MRLLTRKQLEFLNKNKNIGEDILAINQEISDNEAAIEELQSRRPGTEQVVQIPDGLGLNTSAYPFQFYISDPGDYSPAYGRMNLSAKEVFNTFSTAYTSPFRTYYVSITGSGSNDGLTPETPFQQMGTAVTAANTTGQPCKIIVLAGRYTRNGAFGTPAVDIALIAKGGRVNVGAFDNFSAPALDATHTNCYSYAVTNVDRVLDKRSFDEYGNFQDFQAVTTATQCNATPNSYALVSGTIYIHRRDKKAVNYLNTEVIRSSVTFIAPSCNVNTYIGGETDADGFDFIGGGGNGVLSMPNGSVSLATRKCVVAENSSFSYAGGTVNPGSRGVAINSLHGLALFVNCDTSCNASDGFNLHNSDNPSAEFTAITINCTGSNNGNLMLGTSCNAWTTHENIVGIDLGGEYKGNRGGTCRSVNTSKSLLCGTSVKDDKGDIQGGGVTLPTAFRVDDSAKYWLDSCKIDMPARTFNIHTTGTANIYCKNMNKRRGINYGNISDY